MMHTSEIIEYRLKTAEEDRLTADATFAAARYVHTLFLCHLMIEKLLKAAVVKYTETPAPLEHNLANLAEKARLPLSQEQLDLVNEINTFNIRARYDDYKLAFFKKADKAYTEKYYTAATQLYIWLKQEITR